MSKTFFNHRALVSQRSSGYKNTTYAIAELLDNAFDAQASEVKVIFIEKRDESNRKYIDEILICDNGYGMPSSELQYCLQFGGGVNVDIEEIVQEQKIGKFGYGLPNASLSQCPCVYVYSWQEKEKYQSVYLDLDEISQKESIDIPDVHDVSLPPYYNKVGAVIKDKTGVIVTWRRCDRLMNTRATTIIDKSEELVGKLFRYLITDNKKITFFAYEYNSTNNDYIKTEERKVLPNDPLFLLKNTVVSKILYKSSKTETGLTEQQIDIASHYKKYSISENECLPTNKKYEDHCYTIKFSWRGKKYKFPITTSIADLDIQKPGIREGGSQKVGEFYGKKDSICFVRSKREIASGTFGGFYKTSEARNRWWTIEIGFDADADDLLGVHNNKQGIDFHYTKEFDPSEEWDEHTASIQQARERLWYELTNKIELARKAVYKEVLKNHREWDLQNAQGAGEGEVSPLPEGTETTTSVSSHVDGKRESQFTDEEKDALFNRLKEKYQNIDDSDIKRAINKFDSSLVRGCVLYHESESEALWSITTVYDFLIVLVNTNHEFYKNVLLPLRVNKVEAALAALELFISSLASEENEHFSKGEQKDTIELYRSYVGLHLNRYIRELNITENDFSPMLESISEDE